MLKGELKLYKPKLYLILLDLGIIIANVCFVFLFFPLTTSEPFKKYAGAIVLFSVVWLLTSYLFLRYRKLQTRSFFNQVFHLFYVALIVFALFGGFILIQPQSPYSERVLTSVLIGVFVLEYLFLFIYFAYKYATQYEIPDLHYEKRDDAVARPSFPISDDALRERKERILENVGTKAFDFIDRQIHWGESGTLIISENKPDELAKIEYYQYSAIIQMKPLNAIRGINRMLASCNEKLPDDGIIVCCYQSQHTFKHFIFNNRPTLIAYGYYIGHFIVHRIFPKFFLTKRLYYDITGGRKRILSKTEVLGRLVYSGFSVEKQVKINRLNFVIARRVRNAIVEGQRNYGLFIKLQRHGKDGKLFNVYKLRTMHPYSEFLQEYIYQQHSLAVGGKIKHDIRVTSFGRIARKFWLDELPMIWNLLKGNLKPVGVRPLSKQYFGLYSKELQEKRIRHRPGLLPPFYADMPKTLDEIEASEMNYLTECEKNGTLKTDIKYFFLILKNIVFKKARSA